MGNFTSSGYCPDMFYASYVFDGREKFCIGIGFFSVLYQTGNP